MIWAPAGFAPPLMKEPVFGRIIKLWAHVPNSLPADKADGFPQGLGALAGDFAGAELGSNFGAPKDFVRHPIAHAWKPALEEQGSFDRKLAMPLEKVSHLALREFIAGERGWNL
jgi:hypothetical protein